MGGPIRHANNAALATTGSPDADVEPVGQIGWANNDLPRQVHAASRGRHIVQLDVDWIARDTWGADHRMPVQPAGTGNNLDAARRDANRSRDVIHRFFG